MVVLCCLASGFGWPRLPKRWMLSTLTTSAPGSLSSMQVYGPSTRHARVWFYSPQVCHSSLFLRPIPKDNVWGQERITALDSNPLLTTDKVW